MSNNEEASDILRNILRLQAEQTELIGRLAQLQLGEPTGQRQGRHAQAVVIQEEPAQPFVVVPEIVQDQDRTLQVGDRVRIRNPKTNQPNQGTIVQIGNRFISVRAQNGAIIRREPHNVQFLYR